MDASGPIPADLWARLKRLDPFCTFTMQRRSTSPRGRQTSGRIWAVSIHDERGMAWETVHAEMPALADALRAAVDEAEKRGWHLPSDQPMPHYRV